MDMHPRKQTYLWTITREFLPYLFFHRLSDSNNPRGAWEFSAFGIGRLQVGDTFVKMRYPLLENKCKHSKIAFQDHLEQKSDRERLERKKKSWEECKTA